MSNSTQQPFKRIRAMAHIAAITGMSDSEKQRLFAKYYSRGHSKAGATHSPTHKHMSIKRASKAKHNVAKRRAK